MVARALSNSHHTASKGMASKDTASKAMASKTTVGLRATVSRVMEEGILNKAIRHSKAMVMVALLVVDMEVDMVDIRLSSRLRPLQNTDWELLVVLHWDLEVALLVAC